MRYLLIPLAAVTASLSLASMASAQEDTQSPPTTLDVQPSDVTVSRNSTVTTVESNEVTTPTVANATNNDDDDSDKTGLWGLLGLLGLAGLAGLKRRRDNDTVTRTPPTGGAAPRRADGASSSGTT